MRGQFTLEYWRDGDFYVGRLFEIPGVFSQGETLEELQENIQDAYDLMVTQERSNAPANAQQQPVELNDVCFCGTVNDMIYTATRTTGDRRQYLAIARLRSRCVK